MPTLSHPSAPLPYTPDIERIQDDEDITVQELNASLDGIMARVAADGGHAMRGVHAKAHAILRGELTVPEGLPPELAQGLFAKPGTYDTLYRLSTNPGDELPDSVSVPRGLALKVIGVDGPRLPDAEGTSQDFIMLNAPAFAAKTAAAFAGSLKLLARTTDRGEGLKVALSTVLRGANKVLSTVAHPSALLTTFGGAPNTDPLGDTFYSATPFRFGEYVAKFALVPVSANLTARTGQKIDISEDPNAIRDTLREETRKSESVWEFRVQLLRNADTQPIEDATAIWSEEDSPFQTVATLRIPPQDAWDPEQVEAVNETMRFSVWTGLAAHQPLGSVNRARKTVYAYSADFRAGFNGCPIHEPA